MSKVIKKPAIYCRSANDKIHDSHDSIAGQINKCFRAMENLGCTEDGDIYTDIGCSGLSRKRERLAALLKKAKEGKVSEVYVDSMQVLGRSPILVNDIINELEACEVKVNVIN